MTIQHITSSQFEAKPWKNGLGTTYDIALLPTGSNHTSFDLRFALSPILEDNLFSSFPDIERVITPIEGKGLRLEFNDESTELGLLESYRFDSTLTPMGRPMNGPITVINVMANRARWAILSCLVEQLTEKVIQRGDCLFLFTFGTCEIQSGDKKVLMAKHDALIASGSEKIEITSLPVSPLLCAHLRPSGK